MKKYLSILVLVFLGSLLGCVSAPKIPITGKTIVTEGLKANVFDMLPSYAAITTGCRQPIKSIQTEIVSISSDLQTNAAKEWVKGKVVEKWSLRMCGRNEDIFLTLQPDGKGGTIIDYSRKR